MGNTKVTRRRVILAGLAAGLAGCAMPTGQAVPTPRTPDTLRVASFNIRFLDLTPRGADGPRGSAAWEARRPAVLALLQRLDADLVAFQEMESWTGAPQAGPPLQRAWLGAALPDMGVAAATGPDGRDSGQPIFYRRDRLSIIGEGAEPIGPAPGLAGAFAGYADLVTWARFADRQGGRITVLNLHLHYTDRLRRDSGAALAADLAAQAVARGDRVIVLGDFNVGALSYPVQRLRAAGLVHLRSEGASFHFNGGLNLFGAIDHILHGPGLHAVDGRAHVLRDGAGGLWASDHYPVWADLTPLPVRASAP